MIDAMWNSGMASYSIGSSLLDGDLYNAAGTASIFHAFAHFLLVLQLRNLAGNSDGLFLSAGSRCEFRAGVAAPVEVWLGSGNLDIEFLSIDPSSRKPQSNQSVLLEGLRVTF